MDHPADILGLFRAQFRGKRYNGYHRQNKIATISTVFGRGIHFLLDVGEVHPGSNLGPLDNMPWARERRASQSEDQAMGAKPGICPRLRGRAVEIASADEIMIYHFLVADIRERPHLREPAGRNALNNLLLRLRLDSL